jgi:hypothetical protein
MRPNRTPEVPLYILARPDDDVSERQRRLRSAEERRTSELHAERNASMSTWAWVGVGLGAFFMIAALLSLVVAAILGRISREASELFESELWAHVPVTREQVEAKTKAASVGDRRQRQEVGRRR